MESAIRPRPAIDNMPEHSLSLKVHYSPDYQSKNCEYGHAAREGNVESAFLPSSGFHI